MVTEPASRLASQEGDLGLVCGGGKGGREAPQFGLRLLDASFVGAPQGGVFSVEGATAGASTGVVGLGVEFIDRRNLSTLVSYDARLGSGLVEHIVSLGFLVSW